MNNKINEETNIGQSSTNTEIGSRKNPAPVQLALIPIHEVVDMNIWGPTWDEDGVAVKRKNIEKALRLYPIKIHAHIEKGRLMLTSFKFLVVQL